MFDIKGFDERMSKSVTAFANEMETVRAGRANPRILDKLQVENYGTMMPINQVANVSVSEGTSLVIAPWDSNTIKAIEKAVLASDLGITPNSDGKVIRLNFPPLTEDRRKELGKEVKKKSEDAKVAIRNIRRDGVDAAEKAQKASTLTEDELKKAKDDVQKLTDKKIEEIDKILEAKTKEIMTV